MLEKNQDENDTHKSLIFPVRQRGHVIFSLITQELGNKNNVQKS